MLVRFPSLETGWLHKYLPALPQPVVVYGPSRPDAEAVYYRPWRGEVEVLGRFFPGDRGIILLAEPECVANTLAHEYRHHWQWHFGLRGVSTKFDPDVEYWAEIKRYFNDSALERDALFFSHQVSPSWASELWIAHLRGQLC